MKIISHDFGFTLPTVLIGMVVLTIGLLGAAKLLVVVSHSHVFSKNLTTATTLAQAQIATAQRLGYANAETAAGIESPGSIIDYSAYKRVTTVSPNTPAVGIKMVTVTVSWQSRLGTRAVTVPTLLAR